MRTPTEFLEQVAQIIGVNGISKDIKLEFRWDTYDEAKDVLNRVTGMLRALRLLRNELALGTKELRQVYSQKLAHIDQLASEEDQSSYFYSRRTMAEVDSDMRRSVRVERNEAVLPYLGVGHTMTAVELQLRSVQNQIRTSAEYLSRPRSTKKTASVVGRWYFVRVNDESQGPLSAEQVRGLIKVGVLSLQDQVRVEGIDAWIPVSSVVELGDAS